MFRICERDEAADKCAVCDVPDERDDGGCASVVAQEEAGGLEKGRVAGCRKDGSHVWVDCREEDVDERGTGEEAVEETEDGAEEPSVSVDRDEDRVIAEGEEEAEREVREIAEGLGCDRSVVRAVPSKKGRSIRVSRSSLAARMIVVNTRVPTNPPASAAQTLMSFPPLDRDRGVDEGEVAESLGEVAEELTCVRIDLFCVEAEVVGEAEQLFHEADGVVPSADERQCFGEPERASEKCSLAAAHPSPPV